MICSQVPCNDSALFLPGEVVKELPQQGSSLSVDRLATRLGNAHDMLLALPPGMRQALPRARHRQFSFR